MRINDGKTSDLTHAKKMFDDHDHPHMSAQIAARFSRLTPTSLLFSVSNSGEGKTVTGARKRARDIRGLVSHLLDRES